MTESLIDLFWRVLIASVGAILVAIIGRWLSVRERKRQVAREAEREYLTNMLSREAILKDLEGFRADTAGAEISFRDLIFPSSSTNAEDSGTGNWSIGATGGGTSREEVRKEAEEAVRRLRERLEQVERRFPEESTLEKIASINDAILATQIEQLQKSLDQLEQRILTKWDVATIVFALIGAIGVIAGTIFTVANFVLK